MYFSKVSFEEYCRSLDLAPEVWEKMRPAYNLIKLPQRSSAGSAGYDFFLPMNLKVEANMYYVVPTGIRWVREEGDPDVFLMCVPRSGLGVKKGFMLRNTAGIIDMDYYLSDNEGHIMCCFCMEEDDYLPSGKAFMQGIVVPFLKVREDNITLLRNGGFGSSDSNNDKHKPTIALMNDEQLSDAQ